MQLAASTPLLLMGAGCLLLTTFGVSALLLTRSIEHDRRVRDRLTGTTQPFARPRTLRPVLITRPQTTQRRGAMDLAMRVFGFQSGAGRYHVAWWAALALALIVARLGCELLTGLIGSARFLAIPMLWIIIARTYFGWCDGRMRRTLITQLPDALAMIVRSVRVGIPVAQAIATVATECPEPTSHEFGHLHQQILIGVPLDQALQQIAQRTGVAEYRFFATVISLQGQTGGGLTDVLENFADMIRKRVALRSRGYALSSEARTSALVLTVMPGLTGLVLWLIDPAYMSTLFETQRGEMFLGLAVILIVIGTVVMRAIISRTLAL